MLGKKQGSAVSFVFFYTWVLAVAEAFPDLAARAEHDYSEAVSKRALREAQIVGEVEVVL
jgi:hypothetical protein